MNTDANLAAHRPLPTGDALYVERPDRFVDRLRATLDAGRSPVLVAGPVGVGKSTELAQAVRLLSADRFSVLVPLDRFENMRRLTRAQVWSRLAGRLASVAMSEHALPLSREAGALADLRGRLEGEPALPPASVGGLFVEDRAGLASVVSEVARHVAPRRITLLVDGLEKTSADAWAEAAAALAEVPEGVDLVVVVPWHAAYPETAERIADTEKLLVLRPLVPKSESDAGMLLLRAIAARRMHRDVARVLAGAGASLSGIWDNCALLSGGLPRTFLQLLADTLSYARQREDGVPDLRDFELAVGDQLDSLRRLLLPGDVEAIRAADGTDGVDLERARKLRLLSHAILLEVNENGRTLLRAHPLTTRLLDALRHAP